MGLFEQWNTNRFSIYKNQEKTVLKLIEELPKWFDTATAKIDEVEGKADSNTLNKVSHTEMNNKYKISESGNFTGTWHGFTPLQSDVGLAAQVEQNRQDILKRVYKYHVNVRDYGATGNGSTDDTQAIKNAIAYAQSLVIDRFLDGVEIHFPKGTYLISSTIKVTSSNIILTGESISSTVIFAPSSNFDLIHFDGTALSLYAVGMRNIRIYTPSNAVSGKHLKTTKCINALFTDLYLVGWYDGIVVDGCGRTYFDNIILSQENRGSGSCRYALDFIADSSINSDVHFSNIQITPPVLTSNDYTVSIRCSDGIYFQNMHIHGGVLVQPTNIGNAQTCCSIFFTNCYFDTANDSNFLFTGSADNYRNFMFANCYFRSAKKGLEFNSTSVVSKVQLSNCNFSQQKFNGVECKNVNVEDVLFIGCYFSDNNVNNVATYGDMILQGVNFIINGCEFKNGGALGYGVQFKAGLSKSLITGCSFVNSTSAIKFINSGSANKIGMLNGVVNKNRGSATLLTGTTSIVVTHGIDSNLTLTLENIQVTPRGDLLGGVCYWISNLTATTFTINVKTAPTGNVIFTWSADITN